MNNNSSKQVLLSVIGVAILVVTVVGVSFAFFNYSKTSTQTNTLTTGTIYFSTTDGDFMALNNAFPIAASEVATATTDVATATVTVTGNTNYGSGIKYTVYATNASTTMGANVLAGLKFVVSSNASGNITFTPNTGVTAAGLASGDVTLGTGTINSSTGTTAVNATITVKAYFDEAAFFISDTPTDSYTVTRAAGRTIIPTADWNNKSISFNLRVVANQGDYTGA